MQTRKREGERRGSRRLDKAFPVFVSGTSGVAFGVARNISDGGMYVEVRETEPIGSLLMITFAWPGSNAEMSVEAEVRYTSVLNYCDEPGGVRKVVCGMGLRFVEFLQRDAHEEAAQDPGALH